jgi:hypothetical protein
MVAKGTFYGVTAILIAGILVSSSLAVFYYNRYQDQAANSQKYANELKTALASYDSLSGSYNTSLRDYRTTLSLLANAVANMNTSMPAYVNASADLSSLWASYQNLASLSGTKALAYGVHMLVNYGNGTSHWYNDSTAQPGWNGYVVTLVLLQGKVQAIWYPQYGEHFVSAINGVPGTASESWFVWEFGSGGWTASQTGADFIQVHNGTVIAWTLCGYDASFNPTCEP